MRPTERGPFPDLDVVLRETNRLLSANGLAKCESIVPAEDQDTANVNLVGYAGGRRYAIKIRVRNLDSLKHQRCIANLLRERTGLPIPEHLCHSDEGAELPLVVMEHMPGEQLRPLFESATDTQAEALARDWGRCVARFHGASIEPDDCGGWPDLAMAHAGYLDWQRTKIRDTIGLLDTLGWPPHEVLAVRAYLSERDSSFDEPAVPGLVKRDQGPRDALGLLEPEPHVSGLLDWELVSPGDTLWEIVDIFVMLYVGGLGHVWPAFRQGYEEQSSAQIARGEPLEYYTLVRSLIALTWRDQDAARREQARELTRRLLDGESPVLR